MRNLTKKIALWKRSKKKYHAYQAEIDAEVSKLLVKTNRNFFTIAICIASLLIYLQSDRANLQSCLSWLGLLSAAYLTYGFISYYESKKILNTPSIHWLSYFRVMAAILGAAWGSASLFFFHLNDYLHQAFLAMCLAGICGGAIVIYALDRYAPICFAVGLILFFIPPYLYSGDSLSVAISLIFVVFVLYIKLTSLSFGRALRENIALRILSNVHKEENERLAYYDALTNTPNRRLLIERLEHSLKLIKRSKSCMAIMFLDLDNFKTLNDSKGHAVGDLLLQQVAKRLQHSVRSHDTVARIGGDEFVILLEELGSNLGNAKNAVKSIATKILKEIKKPFNLQHQEHKCSPSIGIYICGDEGLSSDEVLKRADAAMYQVKEDGRNNFQFYDKSIQPKLDLLANLKHDLSLALSRQQLEIHFQPQVNELEHIIGAEALLRWHHTSLGTIPPSKFIPLAEDTGLIIPIGNWVLQQTCIQLKAWNDQSKTSHLRVSVNVSALQFSKIDFVEQVEKAIQLSGCNPKNLMLELTESLVIKNVNEVVEKMKSLKKMGVLLSLDDFGIGYSSLSLLKQLPLDELKIDQSFVADALESPDNALIIQTIISMGHSLGINVIAEGVAKKDQESFLKTAGCKTYQGYLFGEPERINRFEKKLAKYQPALVH
jgi:diguanylate cyclase